MQKLPVIMFAYVTLDNIYIAGYVTGIMSDYKEAKPMLRKVIGIRTL